MQTNKNIELEDGARILILGGGPAGAFFAIHLIQEAKKAGKPVNVTLVDPRGVLTPENRGRAARGCNYCAGLISPQLQAQFRQYRIRLPESVICQRFSHIWIHGMWKNFPLKVPQKADLLSVFRGSLPAGRNPAVQGLDAFLLAEAASRGARVLAARAQDIRYSPQGRPCVTLRSGSVPPFEREADFACICTGINDSSNRLFRSFKRLNPAFVPPRTRPALIFELRPGRGYLRKYMDRELYLIVAGSQGLDLDHAALIPKQDFLTVALTGPSIDRAGLPEASSRLIRAFLALPGVRIILPHITLKNTPVACFCAPLTAVSPAKNPFAQRIGLAGDALGARLNRDGLYSAFILSRDLARTVVCQGGDDLTLSRFYDRATQWLDQDNTWGRRLMSLVQAVLKSPFFSRVLYQAFASEMKLRPMDQRPLVRVLWQIGAGAGDYLDMCRRLASLPVFFSLARGSLKTIRNRLTEAFFGLDWSYGRALAQDRGHAYGRYPTVVLREKRDYIKAAIAGTLGVGLGSDPEMERMYAIKIRAPARIIFRELGRFGTKGGRFLKLRFVNVRRVFGAANQQGAVVQYRLGGFPLAMDVRLVRSLENRALFYKPSELFTRNGPLIFDIAPTRDGNSRLVVYTAFDFRQGHTPGARIFWRVFRLAFPDWAHDVVWNHALCCIKAEAERLAC